MNNKINKILEEIGFEETFIGSRPKFRLNIPKKDCTGSVDRVCYADENCIEIFTVNKQGIHLENSFIGLENINPLQFIAILYGIGIIPRKEFSARFNIISQGVDKMLDLKSSLEKFHKMAALRRTNARPIGDINISEDGDVFLNHTN
jgi:hypothetical protein